jgi:hypothetical protein
VVIPDTHGDFKSAVRSVSAAYTNIRARITPGAAQAIKDEDESGFRKRMVDSIKNFRKGILPESFAFQEDASKIVLIQLGDLVDRGPHSIDCIDLFEVLPSVLGWKVIKLYGNHDIWTVLGNPMIETENGGRIKGYIHKDDLKKFVPAGAPLNEESNSKYRIPQFRKGGKYYQRYINSYLAMSRLTSTKTPSTNTLFVHAGIDLDWFFEIAFKVPEFSRWVMSASRRADQTSMTQNGDINAFNRAVRKYLLSDRWDEEKNRFFAPNAHIRSDDVAKSFLWTRRIPNRKWYQFGTCGLVEGILRFFNVARIIVGHTPQERWEFKTMCGGQFMIIDVGMSEWMSGQPRPTAMVMKIDENEAIEEKLFVALEQKNTWGGKASLNIKVENIN